MNLKKTTTRRDFLHGAGAATAGAMTFPYIIPASALGLNGTTVPSNRITIGVIGTGG